MGMSGENLQRALRAVFAGEAADSLARVEAMLARPRLAPADRGMVETLVREFHTLKGAAGGITGRRQQQGGEKTETGDLAPVGRVAEPGAQRTPPARARGRIVVRERHGRVSGGVVRVSISARASLGLMAGLGLVAGLGAA